MKDDLGLGIVPENKLFNYTLKDFFLKTCNISYSTFNFLTNCWRN